MGKVQDYLEEKKMEQIAPMYFMESQREPLSIKIFELKPIATSSAKMWVGNTIDWNKPIMGTRYHFKETSREIIIYEDQPTFGENHGYGTGMGDLWAWSYFASFDKNVIFELYKKELKRLTDKYFLKD